MLSTVSRLRGKQELGHNLRAVTWREMNARLDKDNQISDWTRRPLSADQIDYAALNVEVLLRLYEIFSEEEDGQNDLFG